jgi:hypothetical protein
VAYTNYPGVVHRYGTSAPHRNTFPQIIGEHYDGVIRYRERVAFGDWSEEVPATQEPWQVARCAEFDTVPQILSDPAFISAIESRIVTVKSTVFDCLWNLDEPCENCRAYFLERTRKSKNLLIDDGFSLYTSGTVRLLLRIQVICSCLADNSIVDMIISTVFNFTIYSVKVPLRVATRTGNRRLTLCNVMLQAHVLSLTT